MLKNTSVKYVLNTRDNYLYIISLYSFLIALYIKDVKPISSVQPFRNLQQRYWKYNKAPKNACLYI